MEEYDFIIVGAGSAGLPAAVYAARFKLKTLIIGAVVGGTIINTHIVENWPGIVEISGWDLMEKLKEHVKANEVEIVNDKVTDIKKENNSFIIKTLEKEFRAKTILIATGSERKKLNVKGEKEFTNKGVSYCAVCDGALFKDKVVGVIGGSDSAAKEALFLSEHAKKVYIIYRGTQIKAEPINTERVEKNSKIEILYEKNLEEIFGEKMVTGVKFKEGGELKLGGVFVEIGAIPNSDLAGKLGVKLNDKKEIIIDAESKTNVSGVYAAGDVGNKHFKQAITGASEGVIAAFSAYEHINNKLSD
ncbi:MAG: thioredoxin-disulfide reductase [Candidatus Diapherotrites archaeon]|uniref:Thioredoxin-disulfide reductase n=1 Tax=Candidatus Iainarchaeum sp. TaxID=3101447 RepID=A0A2D6LQ40_9ARCH|nr:thioredoxin-disulfide reductase [Candidatus Diapherotrites archaeon]|tara:strand:+ start:9935 stop:10843 length:909 start_codon:yes stop_codon:yes gene_type:complete